MSIAAMKQALEALDVATTPLAKDRQEVLRAQAALRQAIKQAEQIQPVAFRKKDKMATEQYGYDVFVYWSSNKVCDDFPYELMEPLYTASQQRQPINDEKSRSAFEAFVEKELGDIAVMDHGRYVSLKINNYWRTWLAALGFTEGV